MRKLALLLSCIVIVCSISFQSFALQTGLESFSFRPASDNGEYFGVWDSKSMYQFEWRAGTFFTYEYRPLQLTAGGVRVQGIIDYSIIQHLYGSLGIFDKWLSIGVNLPVGWAVDFRDPNVAGSTFGSSMALGDLRINFKSTLYQTRCKRFGIAAVPFIDIPTGYGNEFFGNGTVNGGGLLVIDAQPWQKFRFSLNAGMSGRSTFNFRDIERKMQLLLSLGMQYDLSKKISLNTEIHSQTRLTGIYQETVESPTEILAGVKWKLGQTGLVASFGGGLGITYGSMSPQARFFTGLTYTPLKRSYHKLKQVIDNTIHFDSGKHEIKEEEKNKLATLKKWIKKTYGLPIIIKGHTDFEGDEVYNQALSINRADEVKAYLIANKIKIKRLTTEGYGERRPIAENKTKEGKAENRRVEFGIVKCK